MVNRRSFLKTTGALAALSLLPRLGKGSSLFNMHAADYPPIGLQTYTLGFMFNAPHADTRAILKQIAAIGIKELETATGEGGLYYGHAPKEFAAMVNDEGMKWVANHYVGVLGTPDVHQSSNKKTPRGGNGQIKKGVRPNFNDNLQRIVDDAAEGGCGWIVCSSSAEGTMEEIKKTTEVFANAGEAAKKNNMQFAYHNHQREFAKVDGITSAYEYILGQTNKDEVFMEVDLAWAVAAGMDPVEMFKEYPGRFPLWHVKDLEKNTKKPAAVGTGIVDFKPIFENSSLAGLKHAFIEQDGAHSIDAPASSVRWLKANVYG